MAGGAKGAVGMRLNVMTALYLPILLYAMSTYKLEAGSLILTSDSLIPHAVPQERTIPLGADFIAPIFYEIRPVQQLGRQMGAAIDGDEEEGSGSKDKLAFQPSVFIDESVSPPGMFFDEASGQIRFNTQTAFDGVPSSETLREFTYRATVVGETVDGEEYSNIVEGTFSVFRPIISVQSNVPPMLYADSRNSLNFSVQGIPENAIRLRDRSTGETASGSTLTWTPTGDTTVVFVSYQAPDGELRAVGERGFRVRPAPPPIVGVRRSGDTQLLTGEQTVNPLQPFEIIVRPDDTYAQAFPDDANYRINGLRIRLTRRGLPPTTVDLTAQQLRSLYNQNRSRATGEDVYEINLRQFIQDVRGDGVQIFVQGLERVNFQNRAIPIDPELVTTAFSFAAR